jgi:hypothetical protein
VTVLERLGHEVVFPPGQTCCGQMHINTGYQRDALPVVGTTSRSSSRTTSSSRRPAPASARSATSTPGWPGGR